MTQPANPNSVHFSVEHPDGTTTDYGLRPANPSLTAEEFEAYVHPVNVMQTLVARPANPSPVTAERVEVVITDLRCLHQASTTVWVVAVCSNAADLIAELWASKEAGDKRIAAAREALGLLNSMILSGESHTAASLALFKKGMGDDS